MLPLLNFSPPLSLRPSPPPFIDDVVKTLNTLATYLVNTGVRSGTAHLYISAVFVVFVVVVVFVVAEIYTHYHHSVYHYLFVL